VAARGSQNQRIVERASPPGGELAFVSCTYLTSFIATGSHWMARFS
jgi:hypothetical protein